MSHLFKNNLKIFFKIFKIIIIFFILILCLFGLKNYNGSLFLYIVFTIISNYLIFFAFRSKAIFFETFFSLLLWLGFWFKLTCTIAFTAGNFKEGVGFFDYSSASFDKSLLVSSIGITAFIISGHFREKILFNYPNKLSYTTYTNKLFSIGQKKIWISYILFFFVIGFINFYLKVYQKGLLPIHDLNFLISGILKWLLIFGLSTISSFLIFNEINFFKKFFLISFLIIILETFVTSISMLSRGMIFNAFALIFGIYKFSNKINLPNKLSYYLKIIFFTLILFYISVSSVNYLRNNFFYIGKGSHLFEKPHDKILSNENQTLFDQTLNENRISNLSQNNAHIFHLIIHRWVGIDGVMSVISKKDLLGLDLLFLALKERAKNDMPTFYELTFGLESMNTSSNQLYENVKGNTLPGIIAFSFYSGSYFFLFFIIFIITIIASYIEYLAFLLSSKNLIFSALIGQVIAFRFIHFGYLPHQSYLLFGSIFLTIIIVFLLNIILKK